MRRGPVLVPRVLIALAVVAAAFRGGDPLAAQDPVPGDTLPADTLPADTVRSDAIPTPGDPMGRDPLAASDTTSPGSPYEPPQWALSLGTGFTSHGDLQAQDIVATWMAEDGTTDVRTMRRGVGADGGLQLSGSVLLGLTPAWAVRAGGAWSTGSLDVSVSGEDEDRVEEVQALTEHGAGEFSILSGEAALRFRMASSRRLQPYAELGVAVLRWALDGDAGPGTDDLDGLTRVGGVAAFGAILPVWGRLAAQAQLSAQYFRTPVRPVAPGPLAENDTLSVVFGEAAGAAYADPRIELARLLRLDVGLSLETGRVGPARPGSGSAAPSSAAPRSIDP
ncbi:MAG TPA: hypothetical protein VK966_06680 [Longimicrobiales bacterium]|nr:hypothetical protein [Longimicrobiales bacterium]